MAMTKVKNLQLWCKKMAEGYRDVEVRDMAASWKSGLAFCAIIHRFRPDLIDYDSLSKENVFENNNLAFEVAEKKLSIPAFLEAEDMVAIRVPDKLSVVTYVSQYYNYFHDKPMLGGPGVNKFVSQGKKKEAATPDKSLTPSHNNVANKAVKKDRQDTIGDKCSICNEKVYLMERKIEDSKLYHRACHRKSEFSPTSKVFKRQTQGPSSEDNDESSVSKLRKIDKEKVYDRSSPEPDFWQRRNQSKQTPAPEKSVVTETKASVKPDPVPSWKKDSESRFGAITGLNKSPEKKVVSDAQSGVKPSNLVNRFKELDERNLKSAEQTNKKTEGKKDLVSSDRLSGISKFGSSASSNISPVPKPRQNLPKTFEKMEVEISQPKPEPRSAFTPKAVSPIPKPRNIASKASEMTGINSKPSEPKSNFFTRPKTAPQKSEISLNSSSTAGNHFTKDSDLSPPPLPPSSPPKLPQSEPPNLKSPQQNKKLNVSASPTSSPRAKSSALFDSNTAQNSSEKKDAGWRKSKVDSTVESKTKRSASPKESDCPVMLHAVVHEPKHEYNKAVLVVPKRSGGEEKKNREVFGGLLKSLAGVRQKHEQSSNGAKAENKSVTSDNSVTVNKPELRKTTFFDKTPTDDSNSNNKQVRPKSSFVSQNKGFFSEPKATESQVKTTITTKVTTKTTVSGVDKSKKEKTVTTVTDKAKISDDVPEWKKQLEKNKQRPKSENILDTKKADDGLTEWQREAEKRKNARMGGYVDPEKAKVNNGESKDNAPPSRPADGPKPAINGHKELGRPKTPEQKKKLVPWKPTTNDEPANRKKIAAEKFVFEDSNEKKPPKKPARLEGETPSSELGGNRPLRPPLPRVTSGPPVSSITKHHLSAYQIQQQLQLIDSKLTELELKGRSLEDAIRKGEHLDGKDHVDDDAEDELMIKWFQLVNEKNDLVRKECDYIYISRTQELEVEQYQIEQQLRHIVEIPETQKTPQDLKEEEFLMMKKVDIVNQRNNIVESIDEDRLRYLEEDRDIQMMLDQKAFKETTPTKKHEKLGEKLGFSKEGKDVKKKDKKDKKKKVK